MDGEGDGRHGFFLFDLMTLMAQTPNVAWIVPELQIASADDVVRLGWARSPASLALIGFRGLRDLSILLLEFPSSLVSLLLLGRPFREHQ